MGIGVVEIITVAIGLGIFLYLAFELVWDVLPDRILNKIDFKPFNCYVCFVAWLALIYGILSGMGWESLVLSGLSALVAFNFNKLF